MEIVIPSKLEKLFKILEGEGFETYLVGGCVRDSLLGKPPKDWDACTSAKPEKVIEILEKKGYRVVPTGLQHGTVTIVDQGDHVEITTFRVDGVYEDHRRPSNVSFTEDIRQDLSRRDFTINAMAYNHQQGLVDPYGGRKDLEDRIVKCVGDPALRFQEDALRMLRAIRFCGQLDFALDAMTEGIIVELGRLLEKISQERVREEFNKILLTDIPSQSIIRLIDTGLMKYIIPELIACVGFEQHNPNHDKDVLHHILAVVDHTEGDLQLRLSALLHDIGKPKTFIVDEKGIGRFYGHHMNGMVIAEQILKRLRYDNNTIENVKILVGEHMSRFQDAKPKAIKKLISRVGIENLNRLFKLQIADKMGAREDYDYSHILRVKEEADRIIHERQPLSVKDLAVDGKDLIAAGIPQGKEIGKSLNDLLEKVLEQPELNNRQALLRLLEVRGSRNE